jgi:glutathione S-transferase
MAGGRGADLKLQGPWASPHVLRVRLALGLKGVSYQYVEEQDLNKDSSSLLLHSALPVLIHGGEPVRGTSLSMVQYVDEAFAGVGPSLLPDDPSERAAGRYLADFIDDTVLKSFS